MTAMNDDSYNLNDMTTKEKCSLERFTQIMEEIENQPAWRARADREADYFDGNQLDSEVLTAQLAKGIPPSIENLIGRTINDILGMEAKNRMDWKVLPESEESGNDVAEAMNQKLNKAEKESNADRACTDAHSSQVRVGLGWVEVARESDPFKFPYRCGFVHRNEIWWDMKSKEPDMSDAMWLLRRRWTDEKVAMDMFPDKKDIIKQAGSGWDSIDLASLVTEGGDDTGLAASLDIERGWTVEEQEWRDLEQHRVCLFELLTRHFRRILVLKTSDGRVVEFDEENEMHRQAVLFGLPLLNANISDIYKTYFLGPHTLHEEKVAYEHGRFPYVPFWGEREDRTNVPYGLIRDLMYLQDEVNARVSRMQWGLAATRTTRTENAVSMKDEAFRQTIGRPDADIILSRKEMARGGVFKVERDFELNTQQYNRLMDLRESIKSVSGTTSAFRGEGGSNKTFAGLTAEIEQSMQSLAKINDNFSYSRKMVGTLLLAMVTEDTMEKEDVIVKGGLIKDDRIVTLNNPATDPGTGVEYKDNDVSRTLLKMTLSDVPSTPSYKQQQLASLSEFAKASAPNIQAVLAPHIANLADVPNKEEIVMAVRRASEAPTEDEIQERIDEAVKQALADSQRDLKSREIDIKEQLTGAQIDKLIAETVNQAITAQYAAMQAAGIIVAAPATAPLADKLLRSGGYEDQDAAPIVPVFEQEIIPTDYIPQEGALTGMEEELPPNTNPGTPANVPGPGSPQTGKGGGIETQELGD